jgi:hypothetical protein
MPPRMPAAGTPEGTNAAASLPRTPNQRTGRATSQEDHSPAGCPGNRCLLPGHARSQREPAKTGTLTLDPGPLLQGCESAELGLRKLLGRVAVTASDVADLSSQSPPRIGSRRGYDPYGTSGIPKAKQDPAGSESRSSPQGEHPKAGPGADRQALQISGGLNR